MVAILKDLLPFYLLLIGVLEKIQNIWRPTPNKMHSIPHDVKFESSEALPKRIRRKPITIRIAGGTVAKIFIDVLNIFNFKS
jgi:hypothetical protein